MNRSFTSAARVDVLYADRLISVRSTADGSVRLAGQIDLTNGDAVATVLEHNRRGSSALIVDVSDLQFIDLYGLRTLALLSHDPLGHPVHLRNVQPSLMRLLGMLPWPTFKIA
jgi:anti-anti-sigma regulatory factor